MGKFPKITIDTRAGEMIQVQVDHGDRQSHFDVWRHDVRVEEILDRVLSLEGHAAQSGTGKRSGLPTVGLFG
jgi:hypothetical protein